MTPLDDAIQKVEDIAESYGLAFPAQLVRELIAALRPDLVIVEAPVVQVSSDLAGLAEREAAR